MAVDCTNTKHLSRDERRGIWRFVLVGWLVLFVVRLIGLAVWPQAADGDESILGVMALSGWESWDQSLFVYGQRYALVLPESWLAGQLMKLMGLDILAVKASSLIWWSLGGVMAGLAIRRLHGAPSGWLTLGLLAACPAWGVWSIKGWPGYYTSFLCSQLVIWLLVGLMMETRVSLRRAAAIGAMIALGFVFQPLWCLVTVPLSALVLGKRFQWKEITAAGLGCTATALLILAILPVDSYWVPALLTEKNPLAGLGRTPERLLTLLKGAYSYSLPLPVGKLAGWGGVIWVAALILGWIAAGCIGGSKSTRPTAFAATAVFACGLLFISWIEPINFGYRYLLPWFGVMIVPLAAALGRGWEQGGAVRIISGMAAALVIMAGAASITETASQPGRLPDRPMVPSQLEIQAMDRALYDLNIRHVYCTDYLLQWNVMFQSRLRVKARWLDPHDRHPAFPAAVDAALYAGEPVALITTAADLMDITPLLEQAFQSQRPLARPIPVGDRMFILTGVDAEFLRQLRFNLNPPSP